MPAQLLKSAQAAPSDSPGWRIERIPGKPLHRTEDGRMALPLWLSKDGKHVVDVELIMRPHEAEGLHAALCHMLGGTPKWCTDSSSVEPSRYVEGSA